MNDMTAIPRHRQTAISFRSNRAAQLLAELTRDGKSQAQVVEEALEKAVAGIKTPLTLEEKIARIDAILQPAHALADGTTFKDIDDKMWDEHGLPI
jgi:hypothetical protein